MCSFLDLESVKGGRDVYEWIETTEKCGTFAKRGRIPQDLADYFRRIGGLKI